MVLTKTQIVNFLNRQKLQCPIGSRKYYMMGAFKILVEKDIILVSDIITEFPELNT